MSDKKEQKLFYRYHDHWCSTQTDTPKKNVTLTTFPGIRQTPKGWWIRDGWGKERWIADKIYRKSFAYHTKEEAMHNFLARKRVQVSIMTNQLLGIRNALEQIELIKKMEGIKVEYNVHSITKQIDEIMEGHKDVEKRRRA